MHPFALQTDHVGFHLPGRAEPLFDDISLTLPHAPHALVGRNGVGKSVLARLLTGDLAPSRGTISRPDKIGYLQQHTASTAGENIGDFLGVAEKLSALKRLETGHANPEDIITVGDDWTLSEDLADAMTTAALDFPLDRPITSLSGGEQTRLALFRLMRENPDYLILDEPSNHLDQTNRRHLTDQIRAWGKGCLIISHDPDLLCQVDVIHELFTLGLNSHGGGYDGYRQQKQVERDAAERALADAQKQTRQAARQHQEALEKQQRRQAQGNRLRRSGSQSKILLDAQKNRSEASLNRLSIQRDRMNAEARSNLTRAEDRLEQVKPQGFIIAKPEQTGGTAIGLNNLVLPHGTKDPINLTLAIGDRMAVTGGNGRGKTTLLRVILGEASPLAGQVRRVRSIGYLDQTGRQFDAELPAVDILKAAHPALTESALRTKLANIGLRRDKALQPFQTLSGGERMKIALLRLFAGETSPALLLLDEPDNHLDLDARQLLIDSLNRYRGAIILVTHSPDLITDVGISMALKL